MYFWSLCQRLVDHIHVSLFLFHWSICLSFFYAFDYYTVIIEVEIRKCDASSFALLAQCFFSYSGTLRFRMNFKIVFSIFVENTTATFTGILLNFETILGSIDILTILILLIHEYRIYFHLFVSSVFFISVL